MLYGRKSDTVDDTACGREPFPLELAQHQRDRNHRLQAGEAARPLPSECLRDQALKDFPQ